MVVELQSGSRAIGQGQSTLGEAVLRTLAYSDVFDFALTAAEIWRSLAVEAALDDVRAELHALSDELSRVDNYYMLRGREALAETRVRRLPSSKQLMRRARFWGVVVAAMPFVRMVAVTGSLAVESAEAGEDIDLLVVTKPRRVWTARGFVTALVRVARLTGTELCPNFVIAEDSLALDDSGTYVARELVQMNPLAGTGVARQMLLDNAWYRDYLPNAEPAANQTPSPEGFGYDVRRLLQLIPEALLGGRAGNALEAWLLQTKSSALRLQAGESSEAVFDERMCKGHVDNHGARIRAALTQRLEALGLQP